MQTQGMTPPPLYLTDALACFFLFSTHHIKINCKSRTPESILCITLRRDGISTSALKILYFFFFPSQYLHPLLFSFLPTWWIVVSTSLVSFLARSSACVVALTDPSLFSQLQAGMLFSHRHLSHLQVGPLSLLTKKYSKSSQAKSRVQTKSRNSELLFNLTMEVNKMCQARLFNASRCKYQEMKDWNLIYCLIFFCWSQVYSKMNKACYWDRCDCQMNKNYWPYTVCKLHWRPIQGVLQPQS